MDHRLLFGLGNPGNQFSHTRHNLGADMVLSWVEYMRSYACEWKTHEKFHARVCEVVIRDTTVTILSPLVFMNESGKVVVSYLRYNPIHRKDILVVHDDLELPLGELRIQEEGSAHGHNGVRSIHEYMGDMNIPRLRIGIGRPEGATPVDKFVLSSFTPEESDLVRAKQPEVIKAITAQLRI